MVAIPRRVLGVKTMKKVISLILFVSFWFFSTFSLVVSPAYASAKCGDALIAFGKQGLAIRWVNPKPDIAKVTLTDGSIFSKLAQVTGTEIPQDFPEKYTKNLQTAPIFNIVETEKDPVGLFKNYFQTNRIMFEAFVDPSKVAAPVSVTSCSAVLQQGVIIYDNEGTSNHRETLFLRNYFHSKNNSENFMNFIPRGGIKMSFPTETIWFPLELTGVNQEPTLYVVVDILTPKPLNIEHLPEPFRLEKSGQMQYQGNTYSVARITGKLATKQKWSDLRLKT